VAGAEVAEAAVVEVGAEVTGMCNVITTWLFH